MSFACFHFFPLLFSLYLQLVLRMHLQVDFNFAKAYISGYSSIFMGSDVSSHHGGDLRLHSGEQARVDTLHTNPKPEMALLLLLIFVLLLSTLQEEEGVNAESVNDSSMQCMAILHPKHSFSQVVKNYATESETSWTRFTASLSSCASCASSGRRIFLLSQSVRTFAFVSHHSTDTITTSNGCPGCVAWQAQQQKRKRPRILPSSHVTPPTPSISAASSLPSPPLPPPQPPAGWLCCFFACVCVCVLVSLNTCLV